VRRVLNVELMQKTTRHSKEENVEEKESETEQEIQDACLPKGFVREFVAGGTGGGGGGVTPGGGGGNVYSGWNGDTSMRVTGSGSYEMCRASVLGLIHRYRDRYRDSVAGFLPARARETEVQVGVGRAGAVAEREQKNKSPKSALDSGKWCETRGEGGGKGRSKSINRSGSTWACVVGGVYAPKMSLVGGGGGGGGVTLGGRGGRGGASLVVAFENFRHTAMALGLVGRGGGSLSGEGEGEEVVGVERAREDSVSAAQLAAEAQRVCAC
jgi:hypothetical protein